MRRTLVIVAVLALLLVGLIPGAAADPAARPFRATLNGEITFVWGTAECAPGPQTQWEAAGGASHLGRTHASGAHCSSYGEYTGEATLVAANGDEVHIQYVGMGAPFEPGQVLELPPCDFEIVGGTGRFAGAEGHGTLAIRALVPLDPMAEPWQATFTFAGHIGY